MLAPVMFFTVMDVFSFMLPPAAPKKRNPPGQRFWRGGMREPSRFRVAQLAGSLHTPEGTTTPAPKTATRIRCRYRLFIAGSRGAVNGIEAGGRPQVESLRLVLRQRFQ